MTAKNVASPDVRDDAVRERRTFSVDSNDIRASGWWEGRSWSAVCAVGHVVVSVVLTWPLASNLDRLPLGTESSSTVPAFNAWTLAWTADRLPSGLSDWWDAPIFWPTSGAFARSETQLPTGILAAAIDAVVRDPVVTYGLVLLVALTLNGVAFAWLARELDAGVGAAWAVGAVGQALPFVAHELGVLQLTILWPMAATFALAVRWSRAPGPTTAAAAGVAAAVTALSCGYYGLYLVVPVATLPVLVRSVGSDRRAFLRDGAAALGAAVVVGGPVLFGHARRTDGAGWRRDTVIASSARWADWLPSGPWWPGWVLVVGGAGGLLIGRRRPAIQWLGAIAVVCVVGSIGARVSVFGWRPWFTVTDRVPGFDRMRSPFRFAAVAQVALVAASTPAFVALWTHRRAAVLVATCVAVVGFPSEGRLADPIPRSAANSFLGATVDRDPVIVLPVAASGRASDFEATTAAMLDGLVHEHPLVNGYSGFFPEGHAAFRRRFRGFPDATSVNAITSRGVRWAVVDRTWLTERRRARLADFDITTAFQRDDVVVLEFVIGSDADG